MLKITFSDGLIKVIDVSPFLGEGISAALNDPIFFDQVSLDEGGGIYWPNGYDFCPNFLHDEVTAVSLIEV